MRVLVIIPCYNEQDNLERVIGALKAAAPEVDYLVINDCSTDNSEKVCKEKDYNYISLPVNLGIGGGVQSGYQYAVENDYDITVQMDGDGQHDPAYLAKLLAPVANGELDMCIGSRFITKEGFQTSRMRRLGIGIISVVIRILCGKKVLDTTSGFRACSKELTAFYARNYAQDYPEPEAIISAHLQGYRVGECAVVMRERTNGVSSISAFRSVYYMVKVVLSLLVYRLTCSKSRKERK